MFERARLSAASLIVAFALTGCGGGGRALLGGGPGGSGSPGSGGGASQSGSRTIALSVTIPTSSSASTSSTIRKPATISSQTSSIQVTVNGGSPQTFNATAPACTGTPLTCTLSVGAPYGLDSFLIETYSGSNGTGTALDAAIVTLAVTAAGPNTASATAGAIKTVNSSADGSGGSYSCTSSSGTCTLREAIAEANGGSAGTTTAILFSGVTSITLTGGTIDVNPSGQGLVIIGPGASVANPPATGAPSASGNLTINGGGSQIFYVTSGIFTISGLTLTGAGGASTNGAIESYANLSVFNTIFSNNSDPNDGGGMYMGAGPNTIVGSTFSNNTAGNGGGVYDAGSAATTIQASTFSGNTAQYGGGMFGANNVATTITSTTFSGNTANNAGAYGGAYFMAGAGATFQSDTFTGNTSYEPSDGYASGGAIFAETGALLVNNSTFTNNVAGNKTTSYSEGNTGYGGAISITDQFGTPTATITNSTFGTSASTGNYAGGSGPIDTAFGGAIYNSSCNPLTLSGNTFNGNEAQGGLAEGGAVNDSCGALTSGGAGLSADTFSNNIADSSACSGECGYGYSGGGALFLADVATLTGTSFNGNQSLGGNEEADGGAVNSYDADLTATNVTFSNNLSSDPYFATGGALTAYDQTVTLTNTQFSSNTATATGPSGDGPGAVGGGMAGNDVSLAFTGVTFASNTSSAPGGGMGLGGGLAEEYADCYDCSVARRPAPQSSGKTQGLAALPKWSNKITTLQTQLTNLAARQPLPSVPRANVKSRVTLTSRSPLATRKAQQQSNSSTLGNVTFTGNTANGGPSGFAYGGGADLSGTPTITGASFSGNAATASGASALAAGGAISYAASSCGTALSFTGTVTGNSALSQGGGLAINPSGGLANGCAATISQSTISSNSVTGAGFAGAGGGGIQCFCTLTLTQSTVASNTVAGNVAGTGGGGLIFGGNNPESTTMTVVNSTIAFNTAAMDGGGALNAGSDDYPATVLLQNDTIYKNTATSGKGGNAIEYANGGYNLVLFQNTIIAGGSAPGDTDTNDAWNGDPVVSLNYNLLGQSSTTNTGSSTCGVTGNPGNCANDLQGTAGSPLNPQLASGLASNGGPTQTLADSSGSPGQGYIPFASGACGTTTYNATTYNGPSADQRGYSRGAGRGGVTAGKCDIGAYEYP